MQVIVEPDTFGPWLGLAGVVLGVGITTFLDWRRSRRAEHKERLRGNQAAADELLAAANALLVVRGMYQQVIPGTADARDWVKLWMHQSERVQKASEELVRYGPIELAEVGMEVASAANRSPVQPGPGGFPQDLEDLLTRFASKMRETLADPKRVALSPLVAEPESAEDQEESGSADRKGDHG